MNTNRAKLEWNEKYSVGVELIDNQHKVMFATINDLIDAIDATPTKEVLRSIIDKLVEYKRFHFVTEEKYFREFAYAGTEDHIAKHQMFDTMLTKLQEESGDDTIMLAFGLVDFLEDWLVNHLMTADQAYKECFMKHGLK
ncbi:MAG: bacteriohemerythrin [Candidatus Moranbacteria bacterium]|nr:bacteriohemerythrin [Candidatus Moranbacteria bacterium]MDD3964533.1 bacteriohemerythrin [Candidatus Moranbacteria bacterium]